MMMMMMEHSIFEAMRSPFTTFRSELDYSVVFDPVRIGWGYWDMHYNINSVGRGRCVEFCLGREDRCVIHS